MYIIMLCIIYYNTCIFNTVLYTIMCMISINNNNLSHVNLWDKPIETIRELSFMDPGNLN